MRRRLLVPPYGGWSGGQVVVPRRLFGVHHKSSATAEWKRDQDLS